MNLFSHRGFAGLIGVAREDITPPAGIYARNWGASAHDHATGVHRPLTLTALTFRKDESDSPLVLISADLGWWRTLADEWHVRGHLIDSLRLDPANVLICMTHTHSGPSICGEDVDKPGGKLIPAYLDRLRDAAVNATSKALSTSRPAVLEWTTGRCGVARNRDLPDPESDRILCGLNPGVPADDTLTVGRICSDADWLATIVNYACHPVTLAWQNTLISPDYVGNMRETVEARTSGAPCLFLLGACGELAPWDQYTADTAIADKNGSAIGYAVIAALENMITPAKALAFDGAVESGAPLANWKRIDAHLGSALLARRVEVELPLQPLPSLSEIERQLADCQDRVEAERLQRKLRVRRAVGDGDSARIPVWIWRLGDSFLVAQPNEPYSAFQTAIRADFPDTPIAVVNVANGHIGYLPPAELYDHDIYQVWQTPYGRGSLEKMIEAVKQEIRLAALSDGGPTSPQKVFVT